MELAIRSDIRDYVRNQRKQIILSVVAALLCFGFLVFGGNIRIDTEELINHPGTTVGWLMIGRFGLALLKSLLGLRVHSTVQSGMLFVLFFVLGANLLTFALYRFSGKSERYPYWVFLLLYTTSNIWSYQIYFSLQQAEVACAMVLLIVAAMLSMEACFVARAKGSLVRCAVSAVFLVVGLGAYQALAAYYIAICIALFLLILTGRRDDAGPAVIGVSEADRELKAVHMEKFGQNRHDRELIWGIIKWAGQFAIAYGLYHVIANAWFMATADYMAGQMGWGRLPLFACIKNVLRTGKNLLLGYGPRNFSFFAIGLALMSLVLFFMCRQRQAVGSVRSTARFWLFLLGMAGLVASPFLMTIYMGEMLVTRSQFALPVVAAFLGMYAIGALDGVRCSIGPCGGSKNGVGARASRFWRWLLPACRMLVVATVVVQVGYNLQLAHTDAVRYRGDVAKTDELLSALHGANGGVLPVQPIIFVGYQKPVLDVWCGRTEMYGWSFYEWDYSAENPTGATHRICGFVQAVTGNALNESGTELQKWEAVRLSVGMSDFPARDSVLVTEEFVVIRLSEVRERTDNNWW